MSDRGVILLMCDKWIKYAAQTGDSWNALEGFMKEVEEYDAANKAPRSEESRKRIGMGVARAARRKRDLRVAV